jgi:hypothetical protein
VTEGSTNLGNRGEKKAVPWLVQQAPLLLTVTVVVILILVRVATWPEAPTPGNTTSIADGFIIVVEKKPEGSILSYGYELPDGTRIFDELPIGDGEGEADSKYGWARQGSGSLILVAYDAADTSVSLPYLEFPFWGTGAWATVVASILWPLAIWVRRRLVPATAPAD